MREEVMNAVDSSKFITIARDSMKGSISKTDPFLIKEKGLDVVIKKESLAMMNDESVSHRIYSEIID